MPETRWYEYSQRVFCCLQQSLMLPKAINVAHGFVEISPAPAARSILEQHKLAVAERSVHRLI